MRKPLLTGLAFLLFVATAVSAPPSPCTPPPGALLLHIADVRGESTTCREWIDLSSARLAITSTGLSGGFAGGLTATKSIDSTSAFFFESAAVGKPIAGGSLTLTMPGGGPGPKVYKFKELRITAVRHKASPAVETLEFNIKSIEPPPREEGQSVKGGGTTTESFQGSAAASPVVIAIELGKEPSPLSGLLFTLQNTSGKAGFTLTGQTTSKLLDQPKTGLARERFDRVAIDLKKSEQAVLARYTMSDAFITESGNQITVTFDQIEFELSRPPGAPAGTTGGSVKVGWNLKSNKKL